MPETIYRDIMEKLDGRGVHIVVDATKNLLLNVMEFRPFLVKPNNFELGEIFGVTLDTKESVVPYASKLIEMGAENVIVSMAGEGAVFVGSNGEVYMLLDEEGRSHRIGCPKGKVVNSVGAGDSMVAGFLAGYIEKFELKYAFKMGISAGSASAYSEYLATGEEIRKLLEEVL